MLVTTFEITRFCFSEKQQDLISIQSLCFLWEAVEILNRSHLIMSFFRVVFWVRHMHHVSFGVYQSTLTFDTFSLGNCPLLHPDQYLCDSLNEWKPGNRSQSTHRVQDPFHSVERKSMLIIPSATVEKKKSGRHFHALFFSLYFCESSETESIWGNIN